MILYGSRWASILDLTAKRMKYWPGQGFSRRLRFYLFDFPWHELSLLVRYNIGGLSGSSTS